MPQQQPSSGPASAPSQTGAPLPAAIPAWFLADSDWKPGKIVQFAPLGSVPRFVVASDDGTFTWVDMEHVRHGDKPAALPRLATDFSGGKRPHTLRLYHGKWMLARPDGRVVKEYDANEQGHKEAMAHWDRLEPEAAKLREEKAEPKPVESKPATAPVSPAFARGEQAKLA